MKRYLRYFILSKVVIVNFKVHSGVNGTLVHLVNALKALVGKRDEAITGLELNGTNFYNHGNGRFRLRLPYRPRGWARW